MALNFPANPSQGQEFTASNNIIYKYDGEKWITLGSANANGSYVLKAGDVMTGQLTLPGGGLAADAIQKQEVESSCVLKAGDVMTGQLTLPGGGLAADAIQKQEVESLISAIPAPDLTPYVEKSGSTMTGDLTVPNLISEGDIQTTSINGGPFATNQIINGNFAVNQRQVVGPVSGFTADRWRPNTSQTRLQYKSINSGTDIPFSNYLSVSSTSTQSILAYLIELPAPGNRGPYESSSTWTLSWYTQQTLTDVDVYVDFVDSSAGANSQACVVSTPQLIESGAWGSSFNRYAATVTIGTSIAATNKALRLYYVGTNSKVFDLAQVQLESGSVATPFEQIPIGLNLSLCQRYYYNFAYATDQTFLYTMQVNSTTRAANGYWPVQLRAAPTVVASLNSGSIANTAVTAKIYYIQVSAGSTSSSSFFVNSLAADAEL